MIANKQLLICDRLGGQGLSVGGCFGRSVARGSQMILKVSRIDSADVALSVRHGKEGYRPVILLVDAEDIYTLHHDRTARVWLEYGFGQLSEFSRVLCGNLSLRNTRGPLTNR